MKTSDQILADIRARTGIPDHVYIETIPAVLEKAVEILKMFDIVGRGGSDIVVRSEAKQWINRYSPSLK